MLVKNFDAISDNILLSKEHSNHERLKAKDTVRGDTFEEHGGQNEFFAVRSLLLIHKFQI